MNIALLGATGYLGSAFAAEIEKRGWRLSRLNWRIWPQELPKLSPDLVINAAGYIPRPSVAACNERPKETMDGNVVLPVLLAVICQLLGIPLAHLSTAGLWTDGQEHGESDAPQCEPLGHGGFYISTKVLAEQYVAQMGNHYIWRLHLPFDEQDEPGNYLSRVGRFDSAWQQTFSMTHRRDFVRGCLALAENQAPYGTYNMVNPVAITMRGMVELMQEHGLLGREPRWVMGVNRGSVASTAKAAAAGVRLRPVREALADSLSNWKGERCTN